MKKPNNIKQEVLDTIWKRYAKRNKLKLHNGKIDGLQLIAVNVINNMLKDTYDVALAKVRHKIEEDIGAIDSSSLDLIKSSFETGAINALHNLLTNLFPKTKRQ